VSTPAPSPAATPRVLVAVLNYGTPDDAVETVGFLQRQDYPSFHLRLVDNASPGDCAAELRRRLPGVDIEVTDRNLGYAGGNNHLMERGLAEGYDYVALCNPDIEVAPDAVRRLVETAERHPDAGVVGGVEVCHFTGEVRAVRGDGFSLWKARVRWSPELPRDGEAVAADYVQGAMVLVSRRMLEAGIRLNEELFMYYDEPDLGFALEAAGLRAYVDPRVVVRHKNVAKLFNARAGYLHQRNRVYMVRRYGKWYHRVAFHLGVGLVELPLKVTLRTLQGRWRFSRACLLGYVDGIAGRMGPGRSGTV